MGIYKKVYKWLKDSYIDVWVCVFLWTLELEEIVGNNNKKKRFEGT